VTLEEATAKSTQLNIMFMETSAKAGHNVKSLFKKIAMSLPGMEKDGQTDANTSTSSLMTRDLRPFILLLILLLQRSTLLRQQRTKYQRHHNVNAKRSDTTLSAHLHIRRFIVLYQLSLPLRNLDCVNSVSDIPQ
jgi:hypothetical protein